VETGVCGEGKPQIGVDWTGGRGSSLDEAGFTGFYMESGRGRRALQPGSLPEYGVCREYRVENRKQKREREREMERERLRKVEKDKKKRERKKGRSGGGEYNGRECERGSGVPKQKPKEQQNCRCRCAKLERVDRGLGVACLIS
jgi:hypothetical protein